MAERVEVGHGEILKAVGAIEAAAEWQAKALVMSQENKALKEQLEVLNSRE